MYKNSPVIDFHVHIFPDELAYRAVMTVLKGDKFSPFSDGTLSRLLADMDERGVDISVVQPIITKQHQLKGTNTWARGPHPHHGDRPGHQLPGVPSSWLYIIGGHVSDVAPAAYGRLLVCPLRGGAQDPLHLLKPPP